MNYIKITPIDVANGPGCRVVLWTAGCNHHCQDCHNPNTWNPNSGQLFDENAKQQVFDYVAKPFVRGITLSGGDPIHPNNINEITKLCKELKEKMPEKDIWCYTGSVYEDICDLELMNYIDVLVDGEFVIAKKNLMLLFRGSENQRLIDVKKTMSSGQIVEYIEEN